MTLPRRIFIIGDFKDDSPTSISIERRHWVKGFIRAGCDVQRFSYADVMRQFSFFGSKRIAQAFARRKTEAALLTQVKAYRPDIVMVLIMKDIAPECIDAMRELAPRATFIGRDVDWLPQMNPQRMAIAQKLDIVIATNAGPWLHEYKKIGVPRCAFIPCPCDPDIQHPYPVEPALQTDIIFTGKIVHGKNKSAADPDREIILKKLLEMPNARVYGGDGKNKILGVDAFAAISNAKIALSITAINTVRMCHSDRFVNCISCGTLTLAKRVPDTELLFEDKKHVRYFDTSAEFFELAEWYIKHDDSRRQIAQAGMDRAHKEFNCAKMAQHTLDVIDKGAYNAPWSAII